MIGIAIALASIVYYIASSRICPNNYLLLETKDTRICIAKFEMKKGDDEKAISTPVGLPWHPVNL